MNGQKFHLLDATVYLFGPSEINSDSRNSDVKPLFLRVILVVRAYFQASSSSWIARRRMVCLSPLPSQGRGQGEGSPPKFKQCPIPHLHPLPFAKGEATHQHSALILRFVAMAVLTMQVISEQVADEC
jgi:hypothetical protein